MGNKAICRMLGYSQDEIKNLGIVNIHPEKDLPYVMDQFERQAKSEFSLSRDMPVKRKDGTVFYADVNATMITLFGKMYLMGLFHDITERREIEDMKRAREIADASNSAKSDFIANMSHELRTPLNSINGFSEVLYDETFGPLNPKQKEYVNYVLTSGKHLLSLINDVLDLARVESGKTQISLSDISLTELLKDASKLVQEMILRKKMEMVIEIDEDIGIVTADERMIKQVIYNLLANAVKFTPEGGKMGIRAKRVGEVLNAIEISIWDTGIGIAPENIDKLFDAFVHLETKNAALVEGTGLGLAISKKFVELHSGRIWIESEGLGKGTTVRFTLPNEPRTTIHTS
jgi:two-component system CheB/CheR fusion protein